MPDGFLTDEQAKSFLNAPEAGKEPIPTAPPSNDANVPDASKLIPATTNAVSHVGDLNVSFSQPDMKAPPIDPTAAPIGIRRERIGGKVQAQRFIDENTEPGVPLDTTTGAGFWERLKSSQREDPEEKIKFWQDLYPHVRPATSSGKPTGGLIVRTYDEQTGKPKDLLVNEQQVTLKDFAEFAATAGPEAVGFFLGTRAGKLAGRVGEAKGIGGAARDVVAGSVGMETVDALRDLTVHKIDDMPVHPVEMIKHRLAKGFEDVLFGAALGVLGKGLGKLITPFGDVPMGEESIRADAQRAAQFFYNEMGEKFPFSPGQKTGNVLLQRFEAQTKKLPGASAGFESLEQEQSGVLQRIMNQLYGLPAEAGEAERAAIPSSEQVGKEGLEFLQDVNQPLETRIAAIQQKIATSTQNNIEDKIANATMPVRQLYPEKVGTYIKSKIKGMLAQFQGTDAALYEKAKSLPGGRNRILIAPSLQTRAAAYIKNELPSINVVTEIPTGLLDQYGNEMLQEVSKRVPAKEFIPSNVLGKLEELSKTGDTKFSLQDLIAMRNEVTNDIRVGEAVPGVQTHHLNQIRNMLTEAIHESTNLMPTSQLKDAWLAANKYHADNVGKFQTRVISAALKKPGEPGYVGDAELVKRIVSGEDKIEEVKNFLGAGSKEYAMLKRSIADSVLSNSVYPGTSILDGGSLLRNLNSMLAGNRKTFEETFGQAGQKLIEDAKLIGFSRKNLKLDAEMVEKGIRDPKSMPRLNELVEAEKAKDAAYKNSILKSIGSKTLPGDLKAGEFVARFIKSASPSEVSKVMDILNTKPDLKWKIQAKVVEDILAQAQREPSLNDRIALRLDPNRPINSEKLLKILGGAEKQRNYEALLGPDTMERLSNMAKLLRPLELQQRSFSSAGGIMAGAQVTEFERGHLVSFALKSLRNKVFSFLMTVPGPKYVGNTLIQQRGSDYVISSLMSATPFLESLVDDYGKRGAADAASRIRDMFNQPRPTQQNRERDFLNR